MGVASPSAQGHAMISTATAAVNPDAMLSPLNPPATIQATSVTTDSAITIGTNTAEMRSASRCTRLLPAWASSTRRARCARRVSSPTEVAVTIRRPSAARVPPVTALPVDASTGADSPVIMLSSIEACPSTTTPSVATFSPGRTTKRSPTCSRSMPTRVPSSSSTSFAASCMSARTDAPARRLERCSTKRPSSKKTVTAAATSK